MMVASVVGRGETSAVLSEGLSELKQLEEDGSASGVDRRVGRFFFG